MRNNRHDAELSAFQAVGEIGFRQAKDEEFKQGAVVTSQAAAPQSLPNRGILKFYNQEAQSNPPTAKVVEINTSNQMLFKQPHILHDEPLAEPSREERFQQNAAIYNSRKQNLI